MHLPTLRQLHYLTILVETKHFGRAAERCFVTQSTLSTGIQELENLLGAPLLERTNRKVLVTSLGYKIAQRAQHILALTTDLVDCAKFEQEVLSGRLRIGLIPTISPFLLPKALPTLRQQLPRLELRLIEQHSEQLLNSLNAGEIDLAVLAFPYDVGQLPHEIFASENFWVVLPPQHLLAKQSEIQASQLSIDELMLLSDGHCLREHALSACHFPTTMHRKAMQGTSLYTLIEMVAGGLGVTLIPEMAVHSDMVKHTDVVIRPLVPSNDKTLRHIGLVWRSSYQTGETVETIKQHFAAALDHQH